MRMFIYQEENYLLVETATLVVFIVILCSEKS